MIVVVLNNPVNREETGYERLVTEEFIDVFCDYLESIQNTVLKHDKKLNVEIKSRIVTISCMYTEQHLAEEWKELLNWEK